MNLQDYQDGYTTRFKFAITEEKCNTSYVSEQSDYSNVWKNLPDGWLTVNNGHVTPSSQDHLQPARLISTPSGDILAVEHETGLELLAVGIAAASATAAIFQAYQAWRANRNRVSSPPTDDALVVETRRGKDDIVTVITIPAHLVTPELLSRLVAEGHRQQ